MQHLNLINKKVQNKSNSKNEKVRRFYPYGSKIDKAIYGLLDSDIILGNVRGLSFMKTFNDYHGYNDRYVDKN